MAFADRIEAVGTARANEQVTLSAPVTERIVRLNFDDGAFVQRGQIVAVLRQAEQTAELNAANARSREAQQQLQRIEALKNRGFATRSNYDTQVAAAAAARAQSQAVAGADRRAGDPRALRRLGLAAHHLGRRDGDPGHRDRDDQRPHRRSSSISPCPRRCSPRSARACRSRRARPLIRTPVPRHDPDDRPGDRSQHPRGDGAGAAAQSGPGAAPRHDAQRRDQQRRPQRPVGARAGGGRRGRPALRLHARRPGPRAPRAGAHRRPPRRPDRDRRGAAAGAKGGHRGHRQGRRRHAGPARGRRATASGRGRGRWSAPGGSGR